MRFKPYPKYKPSGVEWLGDVPEGWTITPLNAIASLLNGYPFDSSLFDSATGYPLVRIRDLNKSVADTYYKGDFVPQVAITSDDVLIGMDGDFNVGRWLGDSPALLNQRMCCIRGTSDFVTRWLEYSISTPLRLINDLTYFTTVKHLSSSQVEKIRIASPPKDELPYVLLFLDRETAKIDTLINRQEKLIELLKEKRQAVISHAVTKGLDPTVPMKDSGVEWLGQVPGHWMHPKIGYVGDVRNGSTPDRSNPEYWAGNLPWLASGKVNDFIIENAEEFITKLAVDSTSISMFPSKSVLVGLVGQGRTRGMAALLNFPAYINQNVAGIIARESIDPTYLHYVLCSGYQALRDLGRGGQQDALNCEILGAFRIPLPPIFEQQAIATHLKKNTELIDTLIAKAEQAIALQKEHRTALISAAVTGKIDVRNEVLATKAA